MARFVRALALVFLMFAPAEIVRAEDKAGPFVEDFAGKAIALASEKDLTTEERRVRFDTLLGTYFDMPAIGQFLLGRYWRTASEQEREAYIKAFTENIVYTYSRRFDEYTGQKLVIDDSREDGRFNIVTSRIVDPNSSQEYRLEWRVIEEGQTFKIVDVVIEGVSMSVTQRQEYASVIQNNGGKVQALINALNRQMAAIRSDG